MYQWLQDIIEQAVIKIISVHHVQQRPLATRNVTELWTEIVRALEVELEK